MTTDPSSDVLERVIRAVADKQRELCDPPYYSEEIARAAIAAMPTIERLSETLAKADLLIGGQRDSIERLSAERERVKRVSDDLRQLEHKSGDKNGVERGNRAAFRLAADLLDAALSNTAENG